MLAIDTFQNKFSILNESIEETFTSIDRFEWQAADDLRQMRDQKIFVEGGYKTFEEYCEAKLQKWGGYRRVNQLLAAASARDALKDSEFKEVVQRESHCRPLLRLVKTPDKLKEAVALACQTSSTPTAKDFAEAAKKVAPLSQKQPKVQEQLFLRGTKVKVSSQMHPRFEQEGIIAADAPNTWQQIVLFSEDEREAISNSDLEKLEVPIERKYPPEYAEAIAQLKEQHQQEIGKIEQEIRIRLQVEAQEVAAQKLADELRAKDAIAAELRERAIALQQKVDELEALRKLEVENQQLKQRIQELEDNRPRPDWANTYTKQAEKVLNTEVKKALSLVPSTPTYDLEFLAKSAPVENAPECLKLLGLALGNLAKAINNTQALSAAAILLNCHPTPQAIALKLEHEQLISEAVADIKAILSKSDCTWDEFWKVAQEYEQIKKEYWRILTEEERSLVRSLTEQRDNSDACSLTSNTIAVGSRVSHSDIYSEFYIRVGTLVEEINEEDVFVVWDKDSDKLKKRYSRDSLRISTLKTTEG